MRRTDPGAPYAAIGLISAAALTYEVLLIRVFAMVHWHHLVATAISLALLGYGASGTFLAITKHRLRRHYPAAMVGSALLFAASTLVCITLAQRIPFDPLALTWETVQLGYLAATFMALALPFFAAATCIGLALYRFPGQIPGLYGSDLIGAGTGALLLIAALSVLDPADTLFGVFVLGAAVACLLAWQSRWHPRTVGLTAVVLLATAWFGGRPTIEPSAYKDLAQALAVIGARLETEVSGLAGTASVVANDTVPIRRAPGLSLQSSAMPPRQRAVFIDGDGAGTLQSFTRDADAAYQRDLLSALPYALRDMPRVAVLNAGVGEAVQQALFLGAAEVVAVEPNPLLYQLACRSYAQLGGEVCTADKVHWVIQSARSFLASHRGPFDLIVMSSATDAAGLDAMRSDFGLTREALGHYFAQLAPDGLLAIDGPTRSPPRLSIRLLATARAALAQAGIAAPERHLALLRAWQRFLLVLSRRAMSDQDQAEIRAFAQARGFDLVWLPDIRPVDANRYQQLVEPQFYRAAAALFETAPKPAAVTDRFDLSPATDDRPFPYRYTRWAEVRGAFASGEKVQLAQLDSGLFVAIATLSLATGIGVLLILIPLVWVRPTGTARPGSSHRLQVLGYFGLLGMAFLFIEIAWIERLQLFLGHPVFAATAVLAAFLVFAGLGSLWSQQRPAGRSQRLLILAVASIVLFSLVYLLFLPAWLERLASLPLVVRIAIVLLLLAPLAFAMGVPFPTGLRALGKDSPGMIPWAWGINGCTSVISAAAAPLVATEIGYSGLIGLAIVAYLALPLTRLAALSGGTAPAESH